MDEKESGARPAAFVIFPLQHPPGEEAVGRLATGELSHCFESHDDLVMILIHRLGEELTGGAIPDFARAETAEDFFRVSGRLIVDFLVEDPKTYQGALEMAQYSLRREALDGLAQRYYREIMAVIVGLLALIEEQGYEWTRPVDEIAWQLLAVNDGIAQCYLATGDAEAAYRAADVMAAAFASQARPRALAPSRTDRPTSP